MAMTLSQTAVVAKQGIVFGIIAFLSAIFLFLGYNVYHNYQEAHKPPVEEKPDTKFGSLPNLSFPSTTVPSSNFTFSLDTTTGGLPSFPKLIKVYFVPQASASLLAADKAQALARNFGLDLTPSALSDTEYQYSNGDRSIFVDLNTNNFLYQKKSVTPDTHIDLSDESLVDEYTNFLSGKGLLKPEFKKPRSKVTLLKQVDNQLVDAPSRAEASEAQIALWPQDIDKMPIVNASVTEGFINAIVQGTPRDIENYLTIKFTYWPIDTTTFSTYPIKTPEQSFEDLKEGKGTVIVQQQQAQVSITSVYLAYYESENFSPYLQPVFVFEGPQFVALVPAITDEYIAK